MNPYTYSIFLSDYFPYLNGNVTEFAEMYQWIYEVISVGEIR